MTSVDPGPLGQIPNTEILPLTRDADWIWGWDAAQGTTWPDDTEIYVKITYPNGTRVVWDSVVSPATAQFHIEYTECNLVPAGSLFTMFIKYDASLPDPAPKIIPWYQGKVKRFDT